MRPNKLCHQLISPPPRPARPKSSQSFDMFLTRAHIMANHYKRQRVNHHPHTQYYGFSNSPQMTPHSNTRPPRQSPHKKIEVENSELKSILDEQTQHYHQLLDQHSALQSEHTQLRQKLSLTQSHEKKAIDELIELKTLLKDQQSYYKSQMRRYEQIYRNKAESVEKEWRAKLQTAWKQIEELKVHRIKIEPIRANRSTQTQYEEGIEQGINMLFDQISENLKRQREMLNRVGRVEKWVDRTKSIWRPRSIGQRGK